MWRERRQDRQAGEPPIQLALVERGEGRLAGRGRECRQSSPDSRRQADLLAAIVAREVRDVEAIENRELDGLVRSVGELARRLVELLDLVHRREIGAAQLG